MKAPAAMSNILVHGSERMRLFRASVLVAGSVSPATPGGLTHRLPVRDLRDAFREQIEALFEGGIDLLVFETFGSLAELVEAVPQGTNPAILLLRLNLTKPSGGAGDVVARGAGGFKNAA